MFLWAACSAHRSGSAGCWAVHTPWVPCAAPGHCCTELGCRAQLEEPASQCSLFLKDADVRMLFFTTSYHYCLWVKAQWFRWHICWYCWFFSTKSCRLGFFCCHTCSAQGFPLLKTHFSPTHQSDAVLSHMNPILSMQGSPLVHSQQNHPHVSRSSGSFLRSSD